MAFAIFAGFAASSRLAAETSSREAPRAGAAERGNWASGVKEIFGTAYEAYDAEGRYSSRSATAPLSKVWFTGSQGLLSESYWPTIDRAQTRDTEFLVSDGESFLFHERAQPAASIEWLERGVPVFGITHRDPRGRFELRKVVFADPTRDVVIVRVRFRAFVPGLSLYVLHKPAARNTPLHDHAEASAGPDGALLAWEGAEAQALVASGGFDRASAAFVGPYDGYSDLAADYRMDHDFTRATNGNISLLARLSVPPTLGEHATDLALGFGPSAADALATARASLREGVDRASEAYVRDWRLYHRGLEDLSDEAPDGGDLYWASIPLLKSMEDKTFEGASIASPSIPWGLHRQDWANADAPRNYQTAGYHLVWPRDLYNMATGFLAVGDDASALATLRRLKAAQFGPEDGAWVHGERRIPRDGSFPQNFWVDGTPYWDDLQLDEVSMPVVLAYRLWKLGHADLGEFRDLVTRATDFVANYGPWSGQERWEELFGISPSTVASEIAALAAGAEMACAFGDEARAVRYRALARDWSSKLESWTFTTSGALGDGRYFERLDGASFHGQPWDPNDDFEYPGANGSGLKKEKNIVDGGFLELVRFGVRSALAPSVLETLPEYDAFLRTEVPGRGPGFKRYRGDLYNQDEATGRPAPGMLWPLLTGERGHYELERGRALGENRASLRARVEPALRAMEAFATPSLMLPEQVWDAGDRAGQPTGAATPLGWAHAEYVKLLRSRREGRIFDRLSVVEALEEGATPPLE